MPLPIIQLLFLLRLHLVGEIIFFHILYQLLTLKTNWHGSCFWYVQKRFSHSFYPACNYLRKWFLAYLIPNLTAFMLNSTHLASKHFLFLEESPFCSNTLCYSSMMIFCGSVGVSLGRQYKFTLSLCYRVLKQFLCHLWAVCRICRHLLVMYLREKEILCYRCSCVWQFLRLGFTSWKNFYDMGFKMN